MKRLTWIAVSAAAVTLAACGGSDDDDAVPPPAPSAAVPESANQSDMGLRMWLLALSREDTEDKEPLDLSTFNPKSADDTEPLPVQ